MLFVVRVLLGKEEHRLYGVYCIITLFAIAERVFLFFLGGFMRAFSRSHPAASLLYFCFVILSAMLAKSPIAIVTLFVFSLLSACVIIGKRVLKTLIAAIFAILLMSFINPIFSPGGDTLLFSVGKYGFSLEAVIYGFFSAVSLVSVYYWFWCFGAVINDEKILYLFGRRMPHLSMLLSMSLGFIPKLKRKYEEIEEAQKCLFFDFDESAISKIKRKLKSLYSLLSSSLEVSLESADSMRARGYGVGKRTSFSIYSWTPEDTFVCVYSSISFLACITISSLFKLDFSYYPTIEITSLISPYALCYSAFCILLCALPLIITVKETLLWQFSKSKI